jgi:hypothetical protein
MNTPLYAKRNEASLLRNTAPSCDTFVQTSQQSFKSKHLLKSPKAIEKVYINIEGLHDPYSDVMMITEKKFNEFKTKLSKRRNSSSAINLLNNYKQHMFKPELETFDFLCAKTKEARKTNHKDIKALTFADIINEALPEARERIKPEQMSVVEEMKKVSSKMSEHSQKILEPHFKKAKEGIENDTFRIQPTIAELEGLRKQIPENKLFNSLIETAARFPSSATSSTVFILQHAGQTHEEIAMDLIKPSLESIEHIKPKSHGGASSPQNYIIASTRMNNLRKSLSLPKFIRRHPDIPRCSQKYINDLIKVVNRGGGHGIGQNIPDVKAQLFEESKGFLDINIDKLNEQNVKAHDSMQSMIANLKEFFNK